MKFYNYILLLTIIALTFLVQISFANNSKLTLEVKANNNLSIKKSLLTLAREMEKTAKMYKTVNRKTYWKNQGTKSFEKLLRSEGYYSGTIDSEINNNTNSINFVIEEGERYKLNNVSIKHKDRSNQNISLPDFDKDKIQKEIFASAKEIVAAEERLSKYIEEHNCLLNLEVTHEATIDHINSKIDVVFIINAGPSATIENVEFEGLETVKPGYVNKVIGLKNGQCFRKSYVAEAQGKLQKTGLFAVTRPDVDGQINDDGSVKITFDLKERRHKSIKAGVNYGTDSGAGLTLGWEHRNFFGNGEKLSAKIFGNQKEQILNINYLEPFFIRDDQNLKLAFKAENKKSKAFISKEIVVSGFIERNISPNWTAGIGTRLSEARIKEDTFTKDNFSLVSTPIFITYDTKNNLLDPYQGNEITVESAPFFSLNKSRNPFFKTQVFTTKYFLLSKEHRHVLALKGEVGNIFGLTLLKVPQTERFYAGGADSIRGYAHQFAEKLDATRKPKGGRSFIGTSVELRLRFTDTLGMVGFLDSGTVYKNIFPKSEQLLFHGAGVGFRYITSFGPLRFDIGFPLKRRKFIDDGFQLYFGIGQSF